MKKTIFCVALLFAGMLQVSAQENITITDRINNSARSSNYTSNRAPLVSEQLIKLPAGSIKVGGWLKTQVELQRNGLNGHLGEISAWLQKEDNAWLTSGGKWGWEEVPYWLRGYGNLAYLLGEKDMLEETGLWVDAIINSQREDGNFGPTVLRNEIQDYWPNMVALWILQSSYEYNKDERILDFMTKYCHYLLSVDDSKFLEDYWEKNRGGDNLWSVVWLYNRTGDEKLLELAEKLHHNTSNWTKSTELPSWHNVNIAQGVREPATYYLFNGNEKFRSASYNVQNLIRQSFGQVPGGMFGSDENARIGFIDPRQGTETCGFAEQMASNQIMLLITGDPIWAENCEDIAFNSLPAAFMPDYKALRYLTCPNQVVSDNENHAPGIHNAGPFLSMNPFSSRCCQHNHGFAWPYYAEHLLFATPDNGLAAVMFNDFTAKVKVAGGEQFTITSRTDYPFDSKISFQMNSSQDANFPFYIRIPKWTKNASIKINGKTIKTKPVSGKYLHIERQWSDGDRIELEFPMEISLRRWQANKNSATVDYGPLTLSLKIEEQYTKISSTEDAIFDSQWQEGADANKWPTYNIHSGSPWNYAIDTKEPIVLIENRGIKAGVNPFSIENSPLVFRAKARQVPSWTIDEYGLCDVLPLETAPKADSIETIELVPMGAARLRISAFPTCDNL